MKIINITFISVLLIFISSCNNNKEQLIIEEFEQPFTPIFLGLSPKMTYKQFMEETNNLKEIGILRGYHQTGFRDINLNIIKDMNAFFDVEINHHTYSFSVFKEDNSIRLLGSDRSLNYEMAKKEEQLFFQIFENKYERGDMTYPDSYSKGDDFINYRLYKDTDKYILAKSQFWSNLKHQFWSKLKFEINYFHIEDYQVIADSIQREKKIKKEEEEKRQRIFEERERKEEVRLNNINEI
ncbi:MAG: hypothetical protein WCY06_02950 [Flavobacteriaceae bacterium]